VPLIASQGAYQTNTYTPGGFVAEPPPEDSYVRYGRIPQRQPRRYKTVKRVELYHGNLVLDCKVPTKLLAMCPRKDEREFTHMRYTAATCDVRKLSLIFLLSFLSPLFFFFLLIYS
jgi:chitin synthase